MVLCEAQCWCHAVPVIDPFTTHCGHGNHSDHCHFRYMALELVTCSVYGVWFMCKCATCCVHRFSILDAYSIFASSCKLLNFYLFPLIFKFLIRFYSAKCESF